MMMTQNFDAALTLEISNGCRFNCTGCGVDKYDPTYPSDEQFEKIKSLVDSWEANGVNLSDFQIGPTDIMTSYNGSQIFLDPRVKDLAHRFKSPIINTSLLVKDDEEYLKLGDTLNSFFKDKPFSINVPFEIGQYKNIKYTETLRRRIRLIKSRLVDTKIETIFYIVNFRDSIVYDKKNGTNLTERILLDIDNIELQDKEDHHRGDYNHMDVVLPHGRVGLNDPVVAKDLLASIDKLNEIHTNIQTKPEWENHTIGINTLHPNEGRIWDTIYYNGEIYIVPFIIDGFAIFDEDYRVKGPWTFENIFTETSDRFADQLVYAMAVPDCTVCEFVNDCAARGVIGVMEKLGQKRCISVIKALRKYFMYDQANLET
jgi:hypothetical protein